MNSDEPMQVLHVDDEPELSALVARYLEREDDRLSVRTAAGPEEGLDALASHEIDCVVSDYDMGATTGIEFLEAVREEHPDLPFVLYTGKGSEEIASDAISAGVTDYLQKENGTGQYAVLANRIVNAVEQYRSERALESSRERLALFVEQTPLGVIEWNESFEFVRVNEAAEEILGYDEAELLGEPGSLIVADDQKEEVAALVDDLLDRRGGYHSVNENVRKSGERIVCEWHNRVVTDDDDEVVAIFSQFQDVTEQKAYEARLEALNEMTQELVAADSRERVAEIGVEAARDLLGLDANAIHLADDERDTLDPVAETDSLYDLIGEPPAFSEEESIAWRVYEDGEPVAIDDVHEDPDIYDPDSTLRSELYLPLGEYGILIAGSPVVDEFDQKDLVLGEILAGNITTALEQIERTEQLRTRERELTRQNERLEEFASIVSHDLQNPLSVADGRLELAREECDSEQLAAVARAHERMDALIDGLLTLARDGELLHEFEPVDLGEVTRAAWEQVPADDGDLVVAGAPTVRADRSRLQQLLENLLRNSVEHSSTCDGANPGNSVEHGSISHHAERGDSVEHSSTGHRTPTGTNAASAAADVTITVGALADGFFVEDDGPGIPSDDREEAFEPGYSTEEEGTGFGLSIVKQIVDAHGWEIDAVEGADGGARFEITGVSSVGE